MSRLSERLRGEAVDSCKSSTCQTQSSAYSMAPSAGAKFHEQWLPPGCKHFGTKVFEECRSLTRVGRSMPQQSASPPSSKSMHSSESHQFRHARGCSAPKPMLAGLLFSGFWRLALSHFFFPRVRTPCGHGAQIIIEGREIQSDGGEKDKDNPTTNQTKPTTAHRRRLHHQVVFFLYQGETSETMTTDCLWA